MTASRSGTGILPPAKDSVMRFGSGCFGRPHCEFQLCRANGQEPFWLCLFMPIAAIPEIRDGEGRVVMAAVPANLRAGIEMVWVGSMFLLATRRLCARVSLGEFFDGQKYHRATGERMADWITNWDEAVARLKETA